ncbi:hypothetical protein K490DRAFT_40002 [Saccharata proteae CBS 121410]|uniref:Methyltransferase type 11 domain-containing protein n=1 Tax=Saccharata proteae CBS 121410 TaxID=1314787 RepID=A0A9P4HZC6_9PEZI|nr:hypothetical protein K490DRAFT_40002 [Saccharata proteae CBS 121410]
MDNFKLPATIYTPVYSSRSPISSPLDRRVTLNTIIEDEPQLSSPVFFSRDLAQLAVKAAMCSPNYSEDFPTPRAIGQSEASNGPTEPDFSVSPISDVDSEPAAWKRRHDDDFDELYDVTDGEAEEVPLKCSNSVKKISSARSSARSSRSRYPSLVIPSPSHWPTIEKLQKGVVSPHPTTPLPTLSPGANILSMLAAHNLQVPATSAAPSLDGSMTSDELDHLSCPSTPDNRSAADGGEHWTAPVQLDPRAMDTLQHLSPEDQETSHTSQVIEIPEGEMQELSVGSPFAPSVRASMSAALMPVQGAGEDPVSALSVPSPGGFFSSLGESARHTWSLPSTQEIVPSTTTAEHFYGVPWRERPGNPIEHVVETRSVWANTTDATPTAVATITSPRVDEILEIKPSEIVYEYNENYAKELEKLGSANLDRTSLWLSAQLSTLASLKGTEAITPIDRETSGPAPEIFTSPSKKSVRFADKPTESAPTSPEETPSSDATFLEGFHFITESTQTSDAFVHRLTRAEAIHLQRRCMPLVHRNQLLGKFELNGPSKIASSRPVSLFYTDDPNVHKEQIAKAQKERQALDLMRPTLWVLSALETIQGGKLITSPASRIFNHTRDAGTSRVLDLGGQGACDWAWKVASDFPMVTVYTVSTGPSAKVKLDSDEERDIEGPPNHRRMTIPNYWTLPFPNGHFDVISARSLYALLKTSKPEGKAMDEYDLCIAECRRCLKPGGYLEFAMLDADIMHARAGGRAQAVSVELRKAGFGEVRRAWMGLPFPRPGAKWNETLNVGADAAIKRPEFGRSSSEDSNTSEKTIGPNGEVEMATEPVIVEENVIQGSTTDVRDVAGIVGAWAWEKWLTKLDVEMGKDSDRIGRDAVQVLEEGAGEGCAWRWLEGWARKPF